MSCWRLRLPRVSREVNARQPCRAKRCNRESSGTYGDARPDRNVQTSTTGGSQPLPRRVAKLRARDSCTVYGADRRTTISLTSIAKPCGHRFAGDSTGLKGALSSKGRCVTCIKRADTASVCSVKRKRSADRTTMDYYVVMRLKLRLRVIEWSSARESLHDRRNRTP